jgi:hypothetical protein
MDKTIDMWHKVWPDPGAFVRASAQDLKAFADLVRADEREACAKVADYYSMHDQDTPADIAAAIRNRGNT